MAAFPSPPFGDQTPIYSPSQRSTLPQLGGLTQLPGLAAAWGSILPTRVHSLSVPLDPHNSLHMGWWPLKQLLKPVIHCEGVTKALQDTSASCSTCSQVNSGGSLRLPFSFNSHQFRGCLLGRDWQIDLTHMPRHKKLKYLLTLVDTFLG